MDFDVAASRIERYDAVNGKLLQVLDADALIVENPENMLAVSLLESIPEFSSDDAEFILEVVDQYLALIEGTDEEKKKIVRRYATVIVGLIAFTIAYRRLTASDETDYEKDGGVTVFLRYTLRLLTTQQRDRLMRLIVAMEQLREKNEKLYGKERISIGFWVGGNVTPNKFMGEEAGLSFAYQKYFGDKYSYEDFKAAYDRLSQNIKEFTELKEMEYAAITHHEDVEYQHDVKRLKCNC